MSSNTSHSIKSSLRSYHSESSGLNSFNLVERHQDLLTNPKSKSHSQLSHSHSTLSHSNRIPSKPNLKSNTKSIQFQYHRYASESNLKKQNIVKDLPKSSQLDLYLQKSDIQVLLKDVQIQYERLKKLQYVTGKDKSDAILSSLPVIFQSGIKRFTKYLEKMDWSESDLELLMDLNVNPKEFKTKTFETKILYLLTTLISFIHALLFYLRHADQSHQELIEIKTEYEKMEEELDLMRQVLNEISDKKGSLQIIVKQYLKKVEDRKDASTDTNEIRNTKPSDNELFQIDLDIIDINRGVTKVYTTIEAQTDPIVFEVERRKSEEFIPPDMIDEMEQICPQTQERLEGSDEPIPLFESIAIEADIPDPSIDKLARKEEYILELLQSHQLELEQQEQKLKDTIQEYEMRIENIHQSNKEKVNDLNLIISTKTETIQTYSNDIAILNRSLTEQKLIESRLTIQSTVMQKTLETLEMSEHNLKEDNVRLKREWNEYKGKLEALTPLYEEKVAQHQNLTSQTQMQQESIESLKNQVSSLTIEKEERGQVILQASQNQKALLQQLSELSQANSILEKEKQDQSDCILDLNLQNQHQLKQMNDQTVLIGKLMDDKEALLPEEDGHFTPQQLQRLLERIQTNNDRILYLEKLNRDYRDQIIQFADQSKIPSDFLYNHNSQFELCKTQIIMDATEKLHDYKYEQQSRCTSPTRPMSGASHGPSHIIKNVNRPESGTTNKTLISRKDSKQDKVLKFHPRKLQQGHKEWQDIIKDQDIKVLTRYPPSNELQEIYDLHLFKDANAKEGFPELKWMNLSKKDLKIPYNARLYIK